MDVKVSKYRISNNNKLDPAKDKCEYGMLK